MPAFAITSVPQLIVKALKKEDLRAEVASELGGTMRYLLNATNGLTFHLWSYSGDPECHIAYEYERAPEHLLKYLNARGRLLRVEPIAIPPVPNNFVARLHRAANLMPVGAIDHVNRFQDLPVLPPDASRFMAFDPRLMGQTSVSQVMLAPVTQMMAGLVRDKWTPNSAFLAPTPRPLDVMQGDYAWRSTLDALSKSSGMLSIACHPLRPSDSLVDYSILCLEYIIGTHSQRLTPADINRHTETLRDVAARKPLFIVDTTVRSNAQLVDAFLQDTDAEAFEVRPTALEEALMASPELAHAGPARKSSLNGPGSKEGFTPRQNPARTLAGLINADELCKLISPPFTLSDALPGVRHFVPRPFQNPYVPAVVNRRGITLGRMSDGQNLELPLDELTRHAFVTGSSGSGKTNTLYHLVSQLDALRIPIMVIDPAKRDFERLFKSMGHETRIFDFKTRWLRFNPFIPPPKISLYAHSVILAKTLSMLFPTNAVAHEMLLSMVKGAYWRKLSALRPESHPLSTEIFAQKTGADLIDHPELIPTFNEFLETGLDDLRSSLSTSGSGFLREAVDHFERRWSNMRRSLLSIAFCPESPSQTIMPLFARSALIELGEWFDKDEANALFALIFGMLYETRLSEFEDKPGDATLRHIAVMDEAHRIVPGTHGGDDSGLMNSQKEITELLSQMIAECRALGQGLIFAEQSASTIAPGVLINSSTKLIHTVLYGKDKEFVRDSLSLSEEEGDFLSYIERGEALALTPLTYQPLLIQVPKSK